jgi:hypothetical protein
MSIIIETWSGATDTTGPRDDDTAQRQTHTQRTQHSTEATHR